MRFARLALLFVAVTAPAVPALADVPSESGPCSNALLAYHEAKGRTRPSDGTVVFLNGGNDTAELGYYAGHRPYFAVDGGPESDKLILRVSEQVFLDMLNGGHLRTLYEYFQVQADGEDCAIVDVNPVARMIITDFEELEFYVHPEGSDGLNLTRKLPEILASTQDIQNLVLFDEHPTPKRDLILHLEGDAETALRHGGSDDTLIAVILLSTEEEQGEEDRPVTE